MITCIRRFLLTASSTRFISWSYLSNRVKEMEKLKENPYFEKYSKQLESKRREDPDAFEDKVKQLAKEAEEARLQAQRDAEKILAEKKQKAKEHVEKGLDAIMKVELLHDKPPEEIGKVWHEYHKDKDAVHAVLQTDEYTTIKSRCAEFRTFLYPVPRSQGYEFFVQQSRADEVYFTPLAAFQRHKENAPHCLCLKHYTDLMDSKGIVLMVGEPDTNVLSVYEAQLLALQLKLYYGTQAGLKLNLVRAFTHDPQNFVYADLIMEFEKYKQDARDCKELFKDGTPV